MQKSESIAALAGALAKAQAEIQGAKKDSENPFFKSRYADLSSVWDACRASLTKNGIAVIQTPRSEITETHTVISVNTLLAHSSGEWVSEELSAVPVKDDPQGIGSCVTYLRRYALSAFTGVAPEDDDGNAASHRNGDSKPTRARATAKAQPASAMRTEWFATIKGAGNTLNAMGDTPEWTLSRANDFANDNFNITGGVDALTEPQLAEMTKLMSARIDDLKAAKKGKKIVPTERDNLVAAIESNLTEIELTAFLAKHYGGKALAELSIEELKEVEKDTGIPF